METLNKETLQNMAPAEAVVLPQNNVWRLPEKVLQFGTGVLLRGLVDYYIDKANKEGVFNGRVVVIKSTGSGTIDEYAAQDNLYTHCIKGVENNTLVESTIINASISRVINANKEWQAVLNCATNKELQIIISNTTEVGISLQENDNIQGAPPQSFPGKLLAFLLARYKASEGSKESGMVIIPTELLVDNGNKLRDIVVKLAQVNNLDDAFITWLRDANDWCNSLVDRIVPGALPPTDKEALEQALGYADELSIMSEPYNLWAIETSRERTRQLLSFSTVNDGVIITPDIRKYRELKLRLLNATHTLSCGLAFLYHFNTVGEAMRDDVFRTFITRLLFTEMVPCVVDDSITEEEARAFATHVIDRFANPFIQHKWLAITMQYTNKMKQRCVPLLVKHYQSSTQPPMLMALGFAAYLLFVKSTVAGNSEFFGERAGERYKIQDDEARKWYTLWQANDTADVVSKALSDVSLWGEDLAALPHFEATVLRYLNRIISHTGFAQLLMTDRATSE